MTLRKLLLAFALLLMAAVPSQAEPVLAYAKYTETTVAMTGGWVSVYNGYAVGPHKLVIADNAGAGCSWSLNPSPATNEGVPFSVPGAPGSYVFDAPVPTNAVYVKCPSGTVLTVVGA